jgi:hypothetical protein
MLLQLSSINLVKEMKHVNDLLHYLTLPLYVLSIQSDENIGICAQYP